MIWKEIGDLEGLRVMCIHINSHYIGRHTKELGADGSPTNTLLGNKDLPM